MEPTSNPGRLAVHPLPGAAERRTLLVCVRRMAAHGLHDSAASMLMLHAFRLDYRRKLVLLRAFMLELAQASHRTIALAPCCAMRMTADEARIIEVFDCAANDPERAQLSLAELTGYGRTCHALSLAVALGGMGD